MDVFVYEPFDFEKEFARAKRERVVGNVSAPIVGYRALLKLKAATGRSQDLTDIEKLRKLDSQRK